MLLRRPAHAISHVWQVHNSPDRLESFLPSSVLLGYCSEQSIVTGIHRLGHCVQEHESDLGTDTILNSYGSNSPL